MFPLVAKMTKSVPSVKPQKPLQSISD